MSFLDFTSTIDPFLPASQRVPFCPGLQLRSSVRMDVLEIIEFVHAGQLKIVNVFPLTTADGLVPI